eukprot:gnl/Spiro4/11842_TR6246_c0_g1_i1.p1 gnl/Spiro4/11842_TR6246_c0_g1~~gnl/Spiro4/11842_TR6246_c0_g1_i1.p1  ORF type:complete len:611 (+),score=175.81 gnl/Spiro4/11842_TR6246_c0_g1_i1:75-1835(+)
MAKPRTWAAFGAFFAFVAVLLLGYGLVGRDGMSRLDAATASAAAEGTGSRAEHPHKPSRVNSVPAHCLALGRAADDVPLSEVVAELFENLPHHCGALKLWNATGVLLYLCPPQLDEVFVGNVVELRVVNRASDFASRDSLPQLLPVEVWARAVGPLIIPVNVSLVPATALVPSYFRLRVRLEIPGTYRFDVRAQWWTPLRPGGEVPLPDASALYLGGRSKTGLDVACELASVVPGSPLFVHALGPMPIPPQRCARSATSGVWRPIDPHHPFERKMLQDALHSNTLDSVGWYWLPNRCEFEVFQAHKISQCFASRRVLLLGDSMVREIKQNLFEFLSHKVSYADFLPCTGPADCASALLDWHHACAATGCFDYQSVVTDLAFLKSMNKSSLSAELEEFQRVWREYTTALDEQSTSQAHSRAVRRHVWVTVPAVAGHRHGHITPARAAAFNSLVRPVMHALGFLELDLFGLTAARPEASWDGLHYSRQVDMNTLDAVRSAAVRNRTHYKPAHDFLRALGFTAPVSVPNLDPATNTTSLRRVWTSADSEFPYLLEETRWVGGVSAMVTQVLLHMVCEPDSQFAHADTHH